MPVDVVGAGAQHSLVAHGVQCFVFGDDAGDLECDFAQLVERIEAAGDLL